MRIFLPSLATLLLAVSPAHAEFYDGNGIYAHCTSAEASRKALCFGYVIGVTDGLRYLGSGPICMPSSASAGQIVDVAVKYMVDHPEARHFSATSIVSGALDKAFPC